MKFIQPDRIYIQSRNIISEIRTQTLLNNNNYLLLF